MGAVRRLVDADTGEAIPYAPYAFSGEHIQVDKARVAAITESKEFTPSQKYLVLWWIGVSPQGMAPLRATGADIAKKVGMTGDAVGKIIRQHVPFVVGGPVNNDDKRKLLDVLHRTAGMTANQRLVVMLYAMHPTDRAGAVVETGANLAKLVGMSPTVFSRTRRQVVEAEWLEESERLAHISYYRLSQKSTGEDVVVPLRRAT